MLLFSLFISLDTSTPSCSSWLLLVVAAADVAGRPVFSLVELTAHVHIEQACVHAGSRGELCGDTTTAATCSDTTIVGHARQHTAVATTAAVTATMTTEIRSALV